MEQVRARLDFLWFLGFDLDTEIPDHSVLSKARARWGSEVFEQFFVQTVDQCVQAGLVNGRLLHVDSTMVKANAHKDTIIPSGPELVGALRQAYQEQAAKLQVLVATNPDAGLRNGSEAVQLAQRACARSAQPAHFDTLAAAYAEAGRFPEAVKAGEKAMALTDVSQTNCIATFRSRLSLYQSGKPYHEPQ